MKKVHKSSGTDDKKLQTSLKKLNVQPIQAIEEVNMFKEDGNVIHFAAPKGMFGLLAGGVPRLNGRLWGSLTRRPTLHGSPSVRHRILLTSFCHSPCVGPL